MRRPWKDLPRCQSCHTGDAVRHLKGEGLEVFNKEYTVTVIEEGKQIQKKKKFNFRLTQAYKTGDPSASPLLAENPRFTENLRKLFKDSKGHGKIACEACHGSTHAIWSNSDFNANDNLTSLQLQGHVGTIFECDTCHKKGSLPMTVKGPHDMHNVNDDRWTAIILTDNTQRHSNFYRLNKAKCQACHGIDLEGTPLSRKITEDKTFKFEDKHSSKKVLFKKGQIIGCSTDCHEKPS
jgi:hypothetical protein